MGFLFDALIGWLVGSVGDGRKPPTWIRLIDVVVLLLFVGLVIWLVVRS